MKIIDDFSAYVVGEQFIMSQILKEEAEAKAAAEKAKSQDEWFAQAFERMRKELGLTDTTIETNSDNTTNTNHMEDKITIPETKKCSKCGEVKPLTEFSKKNTTKSGYGYMCRACATEYNKQYRRSHVQKPKAQKAEAPKAEPIAQQPIEAAPSAPSLEAQVGGDHYKRFEIQPIEFIQRNGLPFIEGNVVKYVCRHRFKNGREDLLKARHYIDMLIELKYPEQ